MTTKLGIGRAPAGASTGLQRRASASSPSLKQGTRSACAGERPAPLRRAGKRIKAAVQRIAQWLIAEPFVGVLPLETRKRIVMRLGRGSFVAQSFLGRELLGDLAKDAPMEFYRLMWAHHVGGQFYAKTYEVSQRFGAENLEPSRIKLLEMVCSLLRQRGLAPEKDVKSIFDVGCSLGYLLRFLETEKFPAAECLRGLDVDQYAVETGNAYLRRLGSKVELVTGDISGLDCLMGRRKYDVVLCCGVLMYVNEEAAAKTVRTMLAHTRGILGVISLAHPRINNVNLTASCLRPNSHGFVHNVPGMVSKAGGRVAVQEWTGPETACPSDVSAPFFTVAHPDQLGPANSS